MCRYKQHLAQLIRLVHLTWLGPWIRMHLILPEPMDPVCRVGPVHPVELQLGQLGQLGLFNWFDRAKTLATGAHTLCLSWLKKNIMIHYGSIMFYVFYHFLVFHLDLSPTLSSFCSSAAEKTRNRVAWETIACDSCCCQLTWVKNGHHQVML